MVPPGSGIGHERGFSWWTYLFVFVLFFFFFPNFLRCTKYTISLLYVPWKHIFWKRFRWDNTVLWKQTLNWAPSFFSEACLCPCPPANPQAWLLHSELCSTLQTPSPLPLSQLWTLCPPSWPRFLPSAVCWHFSLQEVSDDPIGYKSALVISNLESINLLSNRTCYWAQLLLAPLLACFPGLSLQEGTAEPKHLPVMQLTAAIAPDKKSYIIITRREEWV